MEPILFIDFETRSACDIKRAGAEVYARHESTDILCIGYAIDDDAVSVVHPTRVADHLLERVRSGIKTVAHNAPFELAIWNNVGVKKYGWPVLRPEQIHCTMAMAYALNLPGSLENAAAAVGLEAQKDTKGRRIMLQLSQPKEDGTFWQPEEAPEKFQAMFDYCEQDIEVERELWNRLLPLSKKEREVWLLDYKINQRGIRVDLKAVKAALELVKVEKKRLDQEMRKVTSNQVATCTATAQLTEWLREQGVELESVAKADVKALLAGDLPPQAKRALELRQEAAKSSTAKLEKMLSMACPDGRIRGTTQFHGAGQTGRWSGRGVQIQNFPRPSLKQNQIDEIIDLLRNTEW